MLVNALPHIEVVNLVVCSTPSYLHCMMCLDFDIPSCLQQSMLDVSDSLSLHEATLPIQSTLYE